MVKTIKVRPEVSIKVIDENNCSEQCPFFLWASCGLFWTALDVDGSSNHFYFKRCKECKELTNDN